MKNPNVTTVDDFTPSYSMLDREVFDYAKRELNKRGLDVKTLFIMHDSVERIWSMLHQETEMKMMLKEGRDFRKRKISLANFTCET